MLRGMLLMAVINLIVQWSMPYAMSYFDHAPDNIDLLQERIEHNITKLKTAEEELEAVRSKLVTDLAGMTGVLQDEEGEEKKRESLLHSTNSARVNVRTMRDLHLTIGVLKSILVRDIDDLQNGLGLQDTYERDVEDRQEKKILSHDRQAYANKMTDN